jgi:lipopolysaccharide export system protein LptC
VNGKQITTTLLLGLLLAIGWWYRPVPQQAGADLDEPERREAYAETVSLQVMDASGRPVYQLHADSMDYFEEEDSMVLQRPFLSMTHSDGSRWEMHAEQGLTGTDSDTVRLLGDVAIHRLASRQHKPLKVNTRDVLVETASELATTSAAATISGNGYRIEAVGLKADLKQHRLELGAQVRGKFDAAG